VGEDDFTMNDNTLRKNLIKLAKDHPELRGDLLPLLKQGAYLEDDDPTDLLNDYEDMRRKLEPLENRLEFAFDVARGHHGPSQGGVKIHANPVRVKLLGEALEGLRTAIKNLVLAKKSF